MPGVNARVSGNGSGKAAETLLNLRFAPAVQIGASP